MTVMSFELPPLPYKRNALEPFLSKESFDYHYGKHHKGYVEKLNKLLPGTSYETMELEEIIQKSAGGDGADMKIFNNAAQIWNHSFFWNCMSPDKTKIQSQGLSEALENSFGSFEAFEEEFMAKGKDHFGSGYLWVFVGDVGKIEIDAKVNALTPLTEAKHPILTCDLWEHAHYIDYRNDRARFLEKFWKKVNWEFVEENFEASKSRHPERHFSQAI